MWTTEIQLVDSSGGFHTYNLSGIAYYDGNHFATRVREVSGGIWYIDDLRCTQQEQPTTDFSYVGCDNEALYGIPYVERV
jgi:hypothetical protein